MYCLCCLLLCTSLITAQPFQSVTSLPEPGNDLQQHFNNLSLADTTAINNQVNYSLTLVHSDIDSAVYLLRDALAKSLYLKYDVGIAAALCDLGMCHTFLGQYEAAVALYRRGEPFARKAFRNSTSLAMFYTSMCSPFYYLAHYDSMYYYAYKAEALVSQKKYKNAAEAIDISSVYNNIGMLWASVDDSVRSLQYLRRARDIVTPYKKKSSVQIHLSQVNSGLGALYLEYGKTDSAMYCFNAALSYYRHNPYAQIGISKVLMQKADTVQALKLLDSVVIATDKSGDHINNIGAKCILGIVHYKQGNITTAEKLLTDVVMHAANKGDIDLDNAYHAYNILAAIKAGKRQYQPAYEYEQKSLELLDSMKTKEKLRSVYELEMAARTAQKDKEINRQHFLLTGREGRIRRQNMWIGAIGAGSLLLVVALFSVYRSSKHKQRLQAEQLLAMDRAREISNLRAMIKGEEKERARMAGELHDGIMVQLSAVKMNIMNLSPEADVKTYQPIFQQIEDATYELRRTAHNLMPDMLLREGLAAAVFYFCNNLQQQAGLQISFQQHGDIPRLQPELELSVYRIVQELLQNVIKHAHAQRVIVQLAQVANRLAITVEDDGVGFDTGYMQAEKGMGLKSIHTRVQVLNGMMDIESKKQEGTTVYLEIEISPTETL